MAMSEQIWRVFFGYKQDLEREFCSFLGAAGEQSRRNAPKKRGFQQCGVGTLGSLLHAFDRCRRRWIKSEVITRPHKSGQLASYGTNISRILNATSMKPYLVGEIIMAQHGACL